MKRITLTLTLLGMMYSIVPASPPLITDSPKTNTHQSSADQETKLHTSLVSELKKTDNPTKRVFILGLHHAKLNALQRNNDAACPSKDYIVPQRSLSQEKEMAATAVGFGAALYLLKIMHPSKL